jgi:hypothetical protein
VSSQAGAQTPPQPGTQAAPKAPVSKPAAAASGKPTGAKPADAAVPAKPGEVQLSDEAELARVAGLYEAGKYPECSSEIERLLDPTGRAPLKKPSIIENARVYWSACLLGAGDTAAADAPLRAAIHENPQMKPPDSLVFPAPVIERFLKVRDSLVNEIRAAEQARIRQAQAEAQRRQRLLEQDRTRMRALEQLAREEVVVTKNHRAWAFVPFGVGQLQNREPRLGYTLLVSEALLGGLSYAAIVVQNRLATQAYEARRAGQTVDEVTQENNIAAWRTVKVGAFWAFAALAVGGVVQAQLEFVPEFREKRKRALPPGLNSSPPPAPAPKPISVSAAPYMDPHGGGFAVMGTF